MLRKFRQVKIRGFRAWSGIDYPIRHSTPMESYPQFPMVSNRFIRYEIHQENMITVRKARIRDVETIVTMEDELFHSQIDILARRSPHNRDDLLLNENAIEHTRKFVKRMVRSRNGLVLVAEMDGKTAGYLLVIIKKNIPIFRLERLAEITDLYVREEFRGNGISTRLKDEAFRWLKSKEITRVVLNVFPGNDIAGSIYEKWGFSTFICEIRMSI